MMLHKICTHALVHDYRSSDKRAIEKFKGTYLSPMAFKDVSRETCYYFSKLVHAGSVQIGSSHNGVDGLCLNYTYIVIIFFNESCLR